MPPWAIVLILAFLLGLGACCVVCVVLYRRAREQTDPVLLIEQQIKEQEALSSDIPSPRHSVDISVGYCEDEWTQCTEYDEARQATWCIPYADLTLEHELAASRYGEVWRAKWTCFGECTNVADLAGKSPRGRGRRKSFEPKVRPVAVKKITRLRASAHLKEFIGEVNMLLTLSHPNVVKCFGACVESKFLALVTDYWPRGCLYAVLHDPTIEIGWRLRLKLAIGAASGLRYLHSSEVRIAHCDLKSHNLIVDEDFNVAVTDFELARLQSMDANGTAGAHGNRRFCGTPIYAAPEILMASHSNVRLYSEQSDVYAMGIVLWELLTRSDPYDGEDRLQLLHSIAHDAKRPRIPPDTPRSYAQLLQRCWAHEKDDRPSFSTIVDTLQCIGSETAHEPCRRDSGRPCTIVADR